VNNYFENSPHAHWLSDLVDWRKMALHVV